MTLQQALDWLRDNLDVLVTIVSALVAVGSAIIARGETRAQRRLKQAEILQQVDAECLDWGRRAIAVLSSAQELALRSTGQEGVIDRDAQSILRAQLSALIDEGRLYFPNLSPDGHGIENEAAFRGLRQPILDALYYAWVEAGELGVGPRNSRDCCDFLFSCRRLLTSELQVHLDPRNKNRLLGRKDKEADTKLDDAIHRAGRLGVVLAARRPGVLADSDIGWRASVPADERQRILHEVQSERPQ